MKLNKSHYLIIGALVCFLLVYFNSQRITWEMIDNSQYEMYLVEEDDIDYTEENVYEIAMMLKNNTNSPEEAIRKTIQYVDISIKYDSSLSVNYCFDEKASTVLYSQKGDCVSMSRLVVALLRAQGIPARTVGGCLTDYRCTPTYAIAPISEPETTDMVVGDYKKRGYLHEWVEAWTPSNGWFIIEATSGMTYDIGCSSYIFYHYDDILSRCIIQDNDFWNLCYNS